jgi:hypothetical protein
LIKQKNPGACVGVLCFHGLSFLITRVCWGVPVFVGDQDGWVDWAFQDVQALHFAHDAGCLNHPASAVAVSFALSFQAFVVFFVRAFPGGSAFVVHPGFGPVLSQFHPAGFDPAIEPAHGFGLFPWFAQAPGFG